MKRRFSALGIVVTCAVVLAACVLMTACSKGTADGGSGAEPKKLQIAVVTNCADPFWFPAQVAVAQAAKDFDVDAQFYMPANATPAEQKQKLEDLLARGVDGIAISPIDPANQGGLLDQVAAKVPLITHDSDAPDTKRRCFIGVDNYEAGLLCGALVKEAIPEGGKIVLFIGNLAQDNAKRRRQGVIDRVLGREPDATRYDEPGQVLSDPAGKYTILDTLTDETQRPRAKANAEDAMNAHPDLACMVGLFNSNAPMCLEAVRRAGKLGKIQIVSFDEAEETLQGIKDGHIHGTVVQDPYGYGYESVRMLAAIARNDANAVPASKFKHIPARRVDASNVDAFWDDLKKKLAAGSGK